MPIGQINKSDVIFLESLGSTAFEEPKFNNIADKLAKLAAQYSLRIIDEIEKKDVASSGGLSDSIKPTTVTHKGKIFTVGIKAKDYASYTDEGVSGWALDRGSRFKFKTKGVDPKGAMVKSIKDWMQREGKSARNVKVSVTQRERKGKQIKDATTTAAVSMAYMIKRMGIKPRHFWRDASKGFEVVIQNELGAALKIDIINNIIK